MAQYKKLSEYTVNTSPNNEDLVPLIVSNGDGTYENGLMEYGSLKGTPGTNGTNGQGVPLGGTTSQYLRKLNGTDYATEWATFSKSTVGLDNVDNTSDANKPVSTAVAAAIASAVSSAVSQAKQESYPVGSLYFNATNNTNPATLLGFGTWVAFGAGRVPVGFDATQTEFDTAEETGGAKTHTLTIAEMPSHKHPITGSMVGTNAINDRGGDNLFISDANGSAEMLNRWASGQSETRGVNLTGGGGAHNNLQPYITVYMWKRTA